MRNQKRPSSGKHQAIARRSERSKSDFDSILRHEEIFMQPWFIPKHIYAEIRRLLPNVHLTKMRFYFEDYGCLKCGERKSLYGANGFCEKCTGLVRGRVARAIQRRLNAVYALEPSLDLSGKLGDGMMAAQSLVGSLRSRQSSKA